jgi:hypothetical protein
MRVARRDRERCHENREAAGRQTIVEDWQVANAVSPTSRRSVRAVHWLSPPGLTRWFSGVIIAVAILGGAVPIATRQRPGLRAGSVIVGEGFSSQAPGDGIDVAYRMFSVPDFAEVCRKARAAEAVRLRPQLPRLRLRVGEPFVRARLKIVALDASGAVLPRVPIAVEVNGPPNVLVSPKNMNADGSLTAMAPTQVEFRIRTICNGSSAETFVPADVRRE